MSDWSELQISEAIAMVVASGVVVRNWTVLSCSNRLVIALGPDKLIAKTVRINDAARLVKEFAVAGHVAAQKGPVAPPVSGTSVLLGESVAVSLWEPVEVLAPPSDAAAYDAYLDLRRSLDTFSGSLPDFQEITAGAARRLDAAILQGLSNEDTALLRASFASSLARLAKFRWSGSTLHGDPHAGNVVATRHGPQWLDLEDVCIGPLEWDLLAFPPHARTLTHDPSLLSELTQLRRACVVIWCASKTRLSVDETKAVAYHMDGIRAEASGQNFPTHRAQA